MKMKDKKAEQRLAKKRSREQLKAQRKKEPSLERPDASLTEKPAILIVCEGKRTEPSYFNQFRIVSARVSSHGLGFNTVSLVNQAIELAKKENYDQVWCVFDKDDFSDKHFNEAIRKAERNEFKVAYSNQSFEYWLILHFDDHQGGRMPRNDYNSKINKLLKPFNIAYDGKGAKSIEEDFFELLNGVDEKSKTRRVELAIKRAKKIYNLVDRSNPAKCESSTTVFKLVEELLKHVE